MSCVRTNQFNADGSSVRHHSGVWAFWVWEKSLKRVEPLRIGSHGFQVPHGPKTAVIPSWLQWWWKILRKQKLPQGAADSYILVFTDLGLDHRLRWLWNNNEQYWIQGIWRKKIFCEVEMSGLVQTKGLWRFSESTSAHLTFKRMSFVWCFW